MTYIPFVSSALKDLLSLKDKDEQKITSMLNQILEKQRGTLEKIGVDNPDYDEELAKIGKKKEEVKEDE